MQIRPIEVTTKVAFTACQSMGAVSSSFVNVVKRAFHAIAEFFIRLKESICSLFRRKAHIVVPAPGGSIPAPGGSIPAPGGSIPAPGGSIPAPGGSISLSKEQLLAQSLHRLQQNMKVLLTEAMNGSRGEEFAGILLDLVYVLWSASKSESIKEVKELAQEISSEESFGTKVENLSNKAFIVACKLCAENSLAMQQVEERLASQKNVLSEASQAWAGIFKELRTLSALMSEENPRNVVLLIELVVKKFEQVFLKVGEDIMSEGTEKFQLAKNNLQNITDSLKKGLKQIIEKNGELLDHPILTAFLLTTIVKPCVQDLISELLESATKPLSEEAKGTIRKTLKESPEILNKLERVMLENIKTHWVAKILAGESFSKEDCMHMEPATAFEFKQHVCSVLQDILTKALPKGELNPAEFTETSKQELSQAFQKNIHSLEEHLKAQWNDFEVNRQQEITNDFYKTYCSFKSIAVLMAAHNAYAQKDNSLFSAKNIEDFVKNFADPILEVLTGLISNPVGK